MATIVTCTYTFVPFGSVSLNQLSTVIAGISLADIDQDVENQYGVPKSSDTTSIVGGTVQRVIVYNLVAAGSWFFTAFDQANSWAASTVYQAGSKVVPTPANGFLYFASIPPTDFEPNANPSTFPEWQPSTAYHVGSVIIPNTQNPSSSVSPQFVEMAAANVTTLPVENTSGFAATGSFQIENDQGAMITMNYTGITPAGGGPGGSFTGCTTAGAGNILPGAPLSQSTGGVNLLTPYYYVASAVASDGESGTTQPVYPTVVGATVVDHHVTWQCAGSLATAKGGVSGTTQPTFPTTLGDYVVDNPGANGIIWTCAKANPPDYAAAFYSLHKHALERRACVRCTAATAIAS